MKNIEEIVDDIVVDIARTEALKILSKASKSRIQEFINYYHRGQYNTCMMHLDTIKMDLVHYGISEQLTDDKFGDIEWTI